MSIGNEITDGLLTVKEIEAVLDDCILDDETMINWDIALRIKEAQFNKMREKINPYVKDGSG